MGETKEICAQIMSNQQIAQRLEGMQKSAKNTLFPAL